MKRWTTVIAITSHLLVGCSNPELGPGHVTTAPDRVVLSDIRAQLTHDLTYAKACELLGKPYGPGLVSGNFYVSWLLDDGNHLATAFSLTHGRLLGATVMTPKGEVVEQVLKDPAH